MGETSRRGRVAAEVEAMGEAEDWEEGFKREEGTAVREGVSPRRRASFSAIKLFEVLSISSTDEQEGRAERTHLFRTSLNWSSSFSCTTTLSSKSLKCFSFLSLKALCAALFCSFRFASVSRESFPAQTKKKPREE
jgi:hypothetical protein